MRRRSLLALLGLAGIGAIGLDATEVHEGVVDDVEVGHRQGDSTSPNRLETTDTLVRPDDIESEKKTLSEPMKPYDFSYEPIDRAVDDSEEVSSVTAIPVDDGGGDRIELNLKPGADPNEWGNRMHIALSVGRDIETKTTIDGRELTFTGGTARGQTALVGTHPSERTVRIARGNDRRLTSRLVREWNLDRQG